jgi:hypothetical protein
LEWKEMYIPSSGVTCTFNAAMAYKDHLYLGESPGVRVFRTTDGSTLTQVVPDRFGDPGNQFIRIFFLFADDLYAAVSNAAGETQFWRTQGTTWALASTHPGHVLTAHGAAIHQGQLYVPFHAPGGGLDVARSPDGVTWDSVASFQGRYGAIAAFDGALYVNFKSLHSGHMEIWRSLDGIVWEAVTTNGFGYTNNEYGFAMTVFDGKLYLGTSNFDDGPEVWSTESGVTWSRVASGGFGDGNQHWGVANMIVAGSQLYLATWTSRTTGNGTEVWRTGDGLNWEQVNQDGFGDPQRNRVEQSMAVYGNQLYLEVGDYGFCPATRLMRGLFRTRNHIPVAGDQEVRTAYGTAVAVTLEATDEDAGDQLTYRLAAPPGNGGAYIQGKQVTYTPHVGFAGLDGFSFVAGDGKMISNQGRITVLVYGDEGQDDRDTGCFLNTLCR